MYLQLYYFGRLKVKNIWAPNEVGGGGGFDLLFKKRGRLTGDIFGKKMKSVWNSKGLFIIYVTQFLRISEPFPTPRVC